MQPSREAVAAELERILASPAFRSARRSQEFLRYVVLNTLDGKAESLKERTIGAGIFGRPADYNTGDDAIVRVKANEVRKRLAQYYMEAGPPPDVQIDVPPGSYIPEFRVPAGAPVVPPLSPETPRRRWRRIAAAIAATALMAIGAALFALRGSTALERFWQPVFRSQRPVLLCLAHPAVYQLTGVTRELLLNGTEPEAVPYSDLVRDPDHYVGVGDALAAAHLTAFLARAGKIAQLRVGSDTSFTDLRNSPAVLIGAYTNQWTMQVTSELRFVFAREGGATLIQDQMDPAQRWVYRSANPPTDYAIVSRIFNSRTGETVIAAAGLSHSGTQMAGEFLTNPEHMEEAMRGAPPDWPQRSLQLVLQAEVIGKTPGPPKVLARWLW